VTFHVPESRRATTAGNDVCKRDVSCFASDIRAISMLSLHELQEINSFRAARAMSIRLSRNARQILKVYVDIMASEALTNLFFLL
jgi:hypothetical protein